MKSIRKHYMTLCCMGNIEVTHIVKDGILEVSFEQAINGGFRSLTVYENGTIKMNDGFNNAEVQELLNFFQRNISVMIKEAKGEL